VTAAGPAPRCAVHPGRPTLDACPVCGRGRCAPDAATWAAGGCAACQPGPRGSGRPLGPWRLAVRAGLAGVVVTVVGGVIATQYVGVHVFSWLVPGLLGIAAGWVTAAAARTGSVASAVAVVSGVLATALGLRLQPGGASLLHPVSDVVPPYLTAIAGALGWRLVAGPNTRSAEQDAAEEVQVLVEPDAGGTDHLDVAALGAVGEDEED
jgi:hypothetical protein